MPRKNSEHSRIVLNLIQNQAWFKDSGWSFTPIVNKTHKDVAKLLADSSLFLSFGYPEGFGLPLAEAVVSGCSVVGYDGIGGTEIFDLCKPFDVFKPVAFRDFHSFLKELSTLFPNIVHHRDCEQGLFRPLILFLVVTLEKQ